MTKKRFSFADAKEKIKDLETELKEANSAVEKHLNDRGVNKKSYQTVLWAVGAFILGAILF